MGLGSPEGSAVTRRSFVGAAGLTIAALALRARAQPAGRVYRIAVLRPTAPPTTPDPLASGTLLQDALGKLGYVEGRNVTVDARYAGGKEQNLTALAREIVQTKPDAIVAVAGDAVLALKRATSEIPIVIFGNFDPVAAGFVASLARPGGNVTGVLIAPEGTLGAKKLELLKEAVPRARHVAVLAPQETASTQLQLPEVRNAATALGLDLTIVPARIGEYEDAFARIVAKRPDALFVVASTFFVRDRKVLVELANRHRLPSIWEWREQVEEGGLMSYGSSLTERYSRVADYLDRILKGAKPGGIPMDQPAKFELSINLRTAKAIGLAIPPSLLQRADQVIP